MTPQTEFAEIEKSLGSFCREFVPVHLRRRRKLSYQVNGYEVKIIERNLCAADARLWIVHPIAKLQFDPETRRWALYRIREDGDWSRMTEVEPSQTPRALRQMIADDRHRCSGDNAGTGIC